MKVRLITVLMVLAAFVIMLIAPLSAAAGTKGRRNTMYAAGAITAYFLIKKKTLPAIIAGAGTYYAYKKLQDAKKGR